MKSVDFFKPCLMGILNLTPDSFSDGGAYSTGEDAVVHAVSLVKQGASIIDVGGESTRPGALRVSSDEQKRRIIPVIKELAAVLPDTLISVDTTLCEVASAALDAGAAMINDVSAGRDDAETLRLAADRRVPVCLMHMQNEPRTMQDNPHYDDVVVEVRDFLRARAQSALRMGIAKSRIILDPGIGFGKTLEHNLMLLANLERIVQLGFPVLLGSSRKRFIDSIYQSPDPERRVAGSCAAMLIGLSAGAHIFRVHDVYEHRQALEVVSVIQKYRET